LRIPGDSTLLKLCWSSVSLTCRCRVTRASVGRRRENLSGERHAVAPSHAQRQGGVADGYWWLPVISGNQAWQLRVIQQLCLPEGTSAFTRHVFVPSVSLLIEVSPWLWTNKARRYLWEQVRTGSAYLRLHVTRAAVHTRRTETVGAIRADMDSYWSLNWNFQSCFTQKIIVLKEMVLKEPWFERFFVKPRMVPWRTILWRFFETPLEVPCGTENGALKNHFLKLFETPL